MRRVLLVLFAVGMIAGFGSAFGGSHKFHHWRQDGCAASGTAPTTVSATPVVAPSVPIQTAAAPTTPIIVQSPAPAPAQVIVVLPQGAIQTIAPAPATNVAPTAPVP